MNLPPMTMRLILRRQGKIGINLWLPLFIIVPIVGVIALALFLILLPLMLIAVVILWRRGLWRPLFFFWPAVIALFVSLRGFEIDVNQNQERVFISF